MNPKSFLPLAILSLTCAGVCRAQDPTPTPRTPRVVQTRTEDNSYRGTPLGDLLAEYSKLSGQKILCDNTISLTTAIELGEIGDASGTAKARLIEKVLFLDGYSLVDSSDETVIIFGPGRNPRGNGLPIYTEPDEIPVAERVFTVVVRLQHHESSSMVGLVQQYIPPGSTVNFAADKDTHQLLVTGPTTVVRSVLKVVTALDVVDRTGDEADCPMCGKQK